MPRPLDYICEQTIIRGKVFRWLAVPAPRNKYFLEQAVIFDLLSGLFNTGTENYAGFSFHSPFLPILP